jgi:hypothetical protein
MGLIPVQGGDGALLEGRRLCKIDRFDKSKGVVRREAADAVAPRMTRREPVQQPAGSRAPDSLSVAPMNGRPVSRVGRSSPTRPIFILALHTSRARNHSRTLDGPLSGPQQKSAAPHATAFPLAGMRPCRNTARRNQHVRHVGGFSSQSDRARRRRVQALP